jgi:hypothetical protein
MQPPEPRAGRQGEFRGGEAGAAADPRAYAKWSKADDAALAEMVRGGATVTEIAHRLQRNRGAIQSRIATLSLTESPRQ